MSYVTEATSVADIVRGGSDGKQKEEAPEDVRLVVANVDGALVPPDKVITSRARSTFPKIIGRLPITSSGSPRENDLRCGNGTIELRTQSSCSVKIGLNGNSTVRVVIPEQTIT